MSDAKASGGWASPSEHIHELAEPTGPIDIPEVTVSRGGPAYGSPFQRPPRPVDPVDPPPEGAGPGHWEYGVRDSDDDAIYASHSGYHHEPFLTRGQAERACSWLEGVVVRRWVADTEWEVAP